MAGTRSVGRNGGIELLALFVTAAVWRFYYLIRLGQTAFANSLDAGSSIYWTWSDSIVRHGVTPASPFFLAPLYSYALAAWRALFVSSGWPRSWGR